MDFVDEIPEEAERPELVQAIKELIVEIRELKEAIREINAPPSESGAIL
tara:strand:+ start:5452 stop:5598 length:147 start_codon:yes stop_codon:yes gene_type:complete